MSYLCTIIKIRDMEEDNTQYFNDEWNIERKYSKEELQKYKQKDANKHTK